MVRSVNRKSLDVVQKEGLGMPTIMDKQLAQRWGAPYVHAAVFAIDIDRVRAHLDELADIGEAEPLPDYWEVFLTAQYLLHARSDADAAQPFEDMLRDLCDTLLHQSEGDLLGAQILFAVFALMRRDTFETDLSPVFKRWRDEPKELLKAVAAFSSDDTRRFVAQCRAAEISPPLAPPVVSILETWPNDTPE